MLQTRVAAAAAQARARRCRSPALIVALAAHCAHRPRLDASRFLLGALLSPDRPGAVVGGRHQPARAARSCATRSTSSRASTTASRCRPCSPSRPRWPTSDDFVWWQFVLQDVTLGLRVRRSRSACSPRRLMPRARRRSRRTSSRSTRSASAFATYGVDRRCRPQGNGLHRRVRRARSRSASAAPTCATSFEARAERHRRDRQARHLRRVRLAADARRAVRRRLGGGRDRRRHAAGRAPGGDLGRAARARGCRVDLKAFMAWFGPKGVATMTFSLLVLGRGRSRRRADLRPRRAVRLRLDPRPRADRHAGRRSGLAQRVQRGLLLRLGNAQAAWRRRSWRNTKRSCCGGRRPSGWSGRKVGHGSSSSSAQSTLRGRSSPRS